MRKNFFVGTSGFSYRDWIGKFYPEDLPFNQWLCFYAKHFSTLELNNTFYRVPYPQTFVNWREKVPSNFVFSVKVNQRITHFKKLDITPKEWDLFWKRVSLLDEKLGVLLFQLPPSFKKNSKRLSDFLKKYKTPTRFAFEFRHQSWFDEEIYQILKAFNCALVFHDARRWPAPPLKTTADFVYIRFHGVETLYNYYYSQEELENWQLKIKDWLNSGLDVFAYFNNDVDGYAVENAQDLIRLLR